MVLMPKKKKKKFHLIEHNHLKNIVTFSVPAYPQGEEIKLSYLSWKRNCGDIIKVYFLYEKNQIPLLLQF